MSMDRIDVVRRALEFDSPPYIPLEIVEVPGIYDAYANLDPDQVEFLPGTENFDSLQATYHWTLEELGTDENGERLRRDEWGCLQRIPADDKVAYAILEKPLEKDPDLSQYCFPDISCTDAFFNRMSEALARYRDRFICAYLDPGPFLIAFNLFGYDGLLMKLYDDVDMVKKVFEGIIPYQLKLLERWKEVGAHMVCYIDEFAGSSGMMFSPQLWREHFKSFYSQVFGRVHELGMYAGCLLDGDVSVILPDLRETGIDLLDVRQMNCMGMERVLAECEGLCVKASIDMMTTLASGSPDDVRREAEQLVETFGRRNGGFMAITLKWHRPSYPEENVRASIEAFNQFREPA